MKSLSVSLVDRKHIYSGSIDDISESGKRLASEGFLAEFLLLPFLL